MQDYETEEQQVEAVKKWLKENGTSLVLGLVLGLSGIFGWRYYGDTLQLHRTQASDLYISVTKNIASGKTMGKKVTADAEKILSEYADTPYAAMVSLALAKYEYEAGNKENAVEKLRWANLNAEGDLRHVAGIRLGKLLLEQKKYDELEVLVNATYPDSFSSAYNEIKGDLFLAKGDVEKAKTYYDKAISSEGKSSSRYLQYKRRELGDS